MSSRVEKPHDGRAVDRAIMSVTDARRGAATGAMAEWAQSNLEERTQLDRSEAMASPYLAKQDDPWIPSELEESSFVKSLWIRDNHKFQPVPPDMRVQRTRSSPGGLAKVAGRKSRVARRYEFRVVLMAVILATTVMVGCEGQRVETVKDEAELSQLQQTLAAAWLNGDRAIVEGIIAPDWISTGPDGRTTNRARVLAEVFEMGTHKIHGLEIDDVDARVFGDAAVVSGRTHGFGEFEGSGYDVVIRFTDTFVRREGRWQAVASHASLVQGPR